MIKVRVVGPHIYTDILEILEEFNKSDCTYEKLVRFRRKARTLFQIYFVQYKSDFNTHLFIVFLVNHVCTIIACPKNEH